MMDCSYTYTKRVQFLDIFFNFEVTKFTTTLLYPNIYKKMERRRLGHCSAILGKPLTMFLGDLQSRLGQNP